MITINGRTDIFADMDSVDFIETLAYVSPTLGEWAQEMLKDGGHTVQELAQKLRDAFVIASRKASGDA
ncbi:hypothetical protein [Brevundimonas sp.]|uniref:hypothetical protein n=1 Tax=Brevundimonas sp. TaxID=1871086 RepID=UPI002D4C516C|nr:hypothetical protein [Brevundimonas sp.]HYC66626.1 hypothetical protein [Brevundimonas sp.]